MKVVEGIQTWWQVQTGEEDTPFDGDSTAFLASLFFHVVLLLALGLVPLVLEESRAPLTITAPLVEEKEEVAELPEEFHFDEQVVEDIAASGVQDQQAALSLAPVLSTVSDVPSPVDYTISEMSDISMDNTIEIATGLHLNDNLVVKGAAGESATGATGAIDRLTHEILLSLEERKTLVVWLFDQSGSLARQRKEIHDRFDRVYEELGVIEAAGNPAFEKYDDKPLLTSVIAFGQEVTLRLKDPTDNLAEIKQAVDSIEQDNSGVERVFSAVYMAAERFKKYRTPHPGQPGPERNVLMVVMTDEAGDDYQQGLENTVQLCRRYEMPVYVIGVPAPFGRQETMVKWVDPDPGYDQTPQWGQVNQGPESFLPERVRLEFSASGSDFDPMDSGFGPFALTRLAYETGGIYFSVHPNRNVNRQVGRGETAAFSAHLKYFFDPEIMRRYRPDYVSAKEYVRRMNENKARLALVQAAQMSWITPMEDPRLRFVKRDEAAFANELTEAQMAAAKLEPKMRGLYEKLKTGEADRPKETSPRWQAGFDLAMGRVLAVKVRTEAYNAMLAKAKRGLNFENEKNNTWVLAPSDDISVGSQLETAADSAKKYLQRVVNEHPGTPWALLAQRELDEPLGWTWKEEFTDLNPPRRAGNNNATPRPPRNDSARMIQKPLPKRPVPKL